MMLETLRNIVQEVNAAEGLNDALNIIVKRVRDAMGTEVCSVYMRDEHDGRLVFRATEGLNPGQIGVASLASGEGLVGLVAAREEPVNLEDAETHPSFQLLEGLGEEPFHAFLGVPIIHQREMLGVLVIQQARRRRFDENEEAFLVTMSAQLAGVIAHARVTGAVQGELRTGAPRWWCRRLQICMQCHARRLSVDARNCARSRRHWPRSATISRWYRRTSGAK
jgi:phosphotransferase system enzyme I (PtsP)